MNLQVDRSRYVHNAILECEVRDDTVHRSERPRRAISPYLIQDENGQPLTYFALRSRFDKARLLAKVSFQVLIELSEHIAATADHASELVPELPTIMQQKGRRENVPSLGYLEFDRIALIPERFWSHHEFCFFLHDQLGQLLVQYERSDAHNLVINAFQSALDKVGAADADIDVLEILKKQGMVPYYKHHIVSHLVLALTADLLHFLYEALSCFEKRKFAVGFSLLRKPLKENLLFLAWLLGNEEDFISRFEKDTFSTLNGVTPERRRQLISDAIPRLATKGAFDADLLDSMIFSKTHPRGLEPVWQRATHLITSQGAQLKTEDLNLNFIFHDAASDEFFDLLYTNLPYVLLFAMQLSLECFSRIAPSNEQTTSHLILASLGAYECLFGEKRSAGVTSMLRGVLKPFLKCVHCGTPFRLTRDNAIRMYIREELHCRKCLLVSPLPLYWLLAQGKVKITRGDGTAPILAEFGGLGRAHDVEGLGRA